VDCSRRTLQQLVRIRRNVRLEYRALLLNERQNNVTTTIENLEAAMRWRQRWGHTGRGGVVVVRNGEVQSWMSQLRNPEQWQPGCVAFDATGKSWTAIAGTPNEGALMWLPDDPIPD